VIESVIVSLWGQLGIVELLMVITYSLHVLWCISDFTVVWLDIIHCLGTVESLCSIVKLKPLGSISVLILVVWGTLIG